MTDHRMNYKILDLETCFQGYFRIDRYKVRVDTFERGGIEFCREVFERGHAVSVIPYDPVQDKVVLVEQFRIGAVSAGRYPWLMEPIAGIIEEGELAEDVVARESLEEANCSFKRLIPLYDYLVSPGACTETVKMYCGICDSQGLGGIFGLPEEGENIKVHVLARSEAYKRLNNGHAANAMAIIALQWLELNYKTLQAGHSD